MKGTLFKLNLEGNPTDDTNWLRRDMWLAQNGNLSGYGFAWLP